MISIAQQVTHHHRITTGADVLKTTTTRNGRLEENDNSTSPLFESADGLMDAGAPFTESELDALFYSCMDATSQELRRRYESETGRETEIWDKRNSKSEEAFRETTSKAEMRSSTISVGSA